MNPKTRTLLADAGLLYAAAIWGATFFMVKDALDHVSPLGLLGYRFLAAALLMLPILAVQKKQPFQGVTGGLVLGGFLWLIYVPQTVGLMYTTASNSGFITGLFIVFVPLFSFMFLKKLPSGIRLVAVLLALAGLWVLTGGLHDVNRGDVMTLLAAMGYAAHILLADRYMKRGADPVVLSFQQFLVLGALSMVTAPLAGVSLTVRDSSVSWVILFLAIFPTITAFLIQLVAQRFTTPVKVALIFSMEPVFAAVFAWTLGGEPFVAHRALGGVMIVCAMILSELPIGARNDDDLHPESAPH